jgi:hypothetical protein
MPTYKRVVNVRPLSDGTFEIENKYGPHDFGAVEVKDGMSLEEFFGRVLRLSPGDRIELNFLDATNPTARVGKPRRPGAGRKPRTNAERESQE